MIDYKESEKVLTETANLVSVTLKIPVNMIDYEIQDGGKFVLFRVSDSPGEIQDEEVRALVHSEINERLKEFDIKWMLVIKGSDDSVIDVIDSLIGY